MCRESSSETCGIPSTTGLWYEKLANTIRYDTIRYTFQPTPQRRSPVQWSTGDLTTVTLCFAARRPRISASTSCSEFRVPLLASTPELDALSTRCPHSTNYTGSGCWSNTECNTRLPLQCSRSWQHNSRATLPISSGFVLLQANFGPGEGICCTTTVLIQSSLIVLSHMLHQQSVWNSLPLDIVSDLSCLVAIKWMVKTELSLIRDQPALAILHSVNDLPCVINRVTTTTIIIQYNYLRALKSWQDGQPNLAHGTETKKHGVALSGRNTTGPPCSVGRPTAHAPGRRRADRPRAQRLAGPPAGSVTDDDDRRP